MWVSDDWDLQRSLQFYFEDLVASEELFLRAFRLRGEMLEEYNYKEYLKCKLLLGSFGIGRVGASGDAVNGVSLRNRILNEKKTELDGMVKWTSENNREIGCLITMDENGVIHFVDVRTASKQEPNHITWWDPKIPEGHTYIGSFHTHTTSSSLLSGPDFDASWSEMMTFENSLGEFSINIMICPNGNDFTLHSVVIDNSMRETYFNWVWVSVKKESWNNYVSPSTIYKTFKDNNFNMNWGYYRSDTYKVSPYCRTPYLKGILPPRGVSPQP